MYTLKKKLVLLRYTVLCTVTIYLKICTRDRRYVVYCIKMRKLDTKFFLEINHSISRHLHKRFFMFNPVMTNPNL
jgi:hypothetical protein